MELYVYIYFNIFINREKGVLHIQNYKIKMKNNNKQ